MGNLPPLARKDPSIAVRTRTTMTRTTMTRPATIALTLCLALAACSGDDRPLVEVGTVERGEVVATVSAPARVDAAARQDVTAAVSGVVVALDATDGGVVTAGQAVVRLESSQVALAQQQAAAAQTAASQVGGIAVDGSSAGPAAAAAQEAVDQLDASSRPAIAQARGRAAELVDPQQRAAAEAAVAAIESSYLNTRAVLLASAQAAAEQRAELTASLTDALNQAVQQATAGQRAQAEAAAALATQQAAGLSVVAPFAGTVSLGDAAATDGGAAAAAALGGASAPDLAGLAGALPGLAGGEGGGTLRVGAPVTAGQTLFTLYDLSARYVEAQVDEVDAPSVRAGQEADVFIDAFPEVRFTGMVESVAVEAAIGDTGGVGYPTRVRLMGLAEGEEDAQGRGAAELLDLSRVGQTASAEIVTETVDSDLVVPSRALVRREEGEAVWVLRDGRAELVELTVETLGEDVAAVDGDLREGDEVLVTGYEDLAEGDEVRTR